MKNENKNAERENIVIGEYRNGKMHYYPSDNLIICSRKVEEKKIDKILPCVTCVLVGAVYFGLMLAWYFGLFV